jgi:hypothetical protein
LQALVRTRFRLTDEESSAIDEGIRLIRLAALVNVPKRLQDSVEPMLAAERLVLVAS